MKTIGFLGGALILPVGTAADLAAFFALARHYEADGPHSIRQDPQGIDFAVLTDRLYRRYLRHTELAPAAAAMACLEAALADMPASAIDWIALGLDPHDTALDFDHAHAGGILAPVFRAFARVREAAQRLHATQGHYEPVMTVPTDMAGYTRFLARPLAAYDALDGAPFWQM